MDNATQGVLLTGENAGELANFASLATTTQKGRQMSQPIDHKTNLSTAESLRQRPTSPNVLLDTSQDKLLARQFVDEFRRGNSLEKPLQRNVNTQPCANGVAELNSHQRVQAELM